MRTAHEADQTPPSAARTTTTPTPQHVTVAGMRRLMRELLPTEDLRVDYDLEHPARRAVHAVNSALQIAMALGPHDELDVATIDECAEISRRMVELLSAVPADIAALHQLNGACQEDLRGLRDQGLEDAREISRLRERNEALNVALAGANIRLGVATRTIEGMRQLAYDDAERASARVNHLKSIVEQLDDQLDRTEPRLAAGGGH